MKCSDYIYLDQAATSFPKPPSVLAAVRRALYEAGGNPGRSAHRLSLAAAEGIYTCREKVAAFFDAPREEGVVFTQNATYALNMAIFSFAKEGGHILISDMEHNAVLRPVCHLAKKGIISYEIYPTDKDTAKEVEKRIKKETCLVIANHASNICGRILPVAKIGALCQKKGIPFLVDASQSAGHLPISLSKMGISVLCAPAHKGLYGIQGAGFALFDKSYPLPPFILGGSGAFSLSEEMPSEYPEHFEAGTLPTPAVFALAAGIGELEKAGISAIHDHILSLERGLREKLMNIGGVRLLLPREMGNGILSFTAEGVSPAILGGRLDEEGFGVRSGLHCAPLAHKALGTEKTGTVRVSLGLSNTKAECDAFARSLCRILKEAGKR
ncbi:MAG: aminotransferase class V-fold PLP-dependent enzyme [Clostridia bacterium]|nr:aminotransferase class V-fold PLP-dependent enzyme [Clostridia bacterium]